jgi:transcriptional regulator with XRE-family HTH domain
MQTYMYLFFMNGKKVSKNSGSFGSRVRELRRRKGITQVALAQQLGVTQRGISYYENEADNPSMDVIERIATALGVSKRLLIEDDDQQVANEPLPIRSLQQKMKVVPKLPPEDQRYLVRTIEMLAQKHGMDK